MSSPIVRRFLELPRAARWLVAFGLAMVAYFAIVEPVIDVTLRIGERADRQRQKLEAYDRRLDLVSRESTELALGLRRFGDVAMPGAPERRPGELNARIAQILRANDVSGHTTRASAGTLRPGPLSEITGEGGRIGTRVTEIQFTASPEQVVRVLADLEQSPVVAAITAVDLAPADDRRTRTVEATITAEAWTLPERGASR